MATTLDIKVEDFVPEYIQLAKKGKNTILSNTFLALSRLAEMYHTAWREVAQGARTLPGLPFFIHGVNYPGSIQSRQISATTWEVYTDYTTKSGMSVTELLENGHGLIDLKPGLLRGPKSKAGKNGRYNIVPYTHGSSGSDEFRSNPMPASIEKDFNVQIKEADAQRKAGATDIRAGKSYVSKSSKTSGGKTVWGQKYMGDKTTGLRTKMIQKNNKRVGTYTWKAGKYESMYKMQQSTERQERSGAITFRIVSAQSDPMSWIVPEQEPWPIRKSIIDFMKPFAEGMLKEALEADLV